MLDTMRKLRTIAVQAHKKIWANRFKDDPVKWPEKGVNTQGERDWNVCPRSFLYDKLAEEVKELHDAIENGEPLEDVLKEAGDVTALAMFLADHRVHTEGVEVDQWTQPKVVCLCGSTRFREEFLQAQYEETMAGNIVLTVGFWYHAEAGITRPLLTDTDKEDLDQLHKRKIDLSDEILVINPNGYTGDSTKSEIQYAAATGKAIRYRY